MYYGRYICRTILSLVMQNFYNLRDAPTRARPQGPSPVASRPEPFVIIFVPGELIAKPRKRVH